MKFVNTKLRELLFIAFSTIIIISTVWLPHLLAVPNFWGLTFNEGFSTIYRNFDGLEYIIIAKTFYDPTLISSLPQNLPPNYFASHFPGYSILIYLVAPILGFLKSMLFISVLSTMLSAWVFYLLVSEFKLTRNPIFLSLLFLILPARWVIVHSVGSSEPTFIFFILTAIYYFLKFEQSGKILNLISAAAAGGFAQLTRPPGILLFVALCLYILWKILSKKVLTFKAIVHYLVLLIIPVTLLGVFFWYSQAYGDFLAYFHSGDNIHLTFPPFQVFNKTQFWVGDIWLEDVIYIFILGFVAGISLWKRQLYPLAFLVLTYLTAATLIAHRDISRYVLPIAPFVIIAFEKVLTSKEFKIILPIVSLAIYLYAQNFILANTAPIPNLDIFNKP